MGELLILAAGGFSVDFSQGVAVIAILSALLAASTVVGVGLQRGRVKRLEESNADLRGEIADERRRREVLSEDLTVEKRKSQSYHDELVDLRAVVSTMTNVMHGVEGPIANLNAQVERTNQLIHAHNDAALTRLDEQQTMLLDVLYLLGDKRSRTQARVDSRKDEPNDPPPKP